MVIDLQDIKKIRRKLNITQKQLAKISGVSQSLIAKIESGKMDPSYSNALKIFAAIDNTSKNSQKCAADVMESRIIYVTENDSLHKAVKLMKEYEISQIPVLIDHKPVGYISESIILQALMEKQSEKVKDIMEEAPPTIASTTRITIVSELLKYYQMVLVSSKGKIIGIITRADVIRKM